MPFMTTSKTPWNFSLVKHALQNMFKTRFKELNRRIISIRAYSCGNILHDMHDKWSNNKGATISLILILPR